MKIFKKLFKKEKTDQEPIIIVSGLPRSGTSMMMKMLEAGGLEPLTDKVRTPDDDNPKGYYEFERVKQLEKDTAWLAEAQGKVVKVISALLNHLPPMYHYKVIFMQRNIMEILASQKQMLIRKGSFDPSVSDDELADKFRSHLDRVDTWIADQPNFDVIYINYNEILQDSMNFCSRINNFLGNRLNVQKMTHEVDSSLYRQRG